RDLLGAAEHAHARGVILRRIVPLTLMLEHTGRAVITDLRYCNWCLPNVPPEERGAGGAFVAPEVRTGSPGEPRSDVYGVAALVDDYELLGEIGTGGFGRVYRARDLGLERDVAMKVLHPSLTTDPSVMERFRREAQLAGGLRHPSIVSIYDISSRAGLQWYTM